MKEDKNWHGKRNTPHLIINTMFQHTMPNQTFHSWTDFTNVGACGEIVSTIYDRSQLEWEIEHFYIHKKIPRIIYHSLSWDKFLRKAEQLSKATCIWNRMDFHESPLHQCWGVRLNKTLLRSTQIRIYYTALKIPSKIPCTHLLCLLYFSVPRIVT